MPMPPEDDIETALAYHERTKHAPYRHSRALGYMDWDTQPDPFRTFEGAPRVSMPIAGATGEPSYRDVVRAGVLPRPMELESIAQLFMDSLAISAWKEYQGARWALRCNPSSGNLHPTEGYLVAPSIPGICDAPSVFHYQPHDHTLELRAEVPTDLMRAIADLWPPGTCFLGLTTIAWRESWKYGERAFRYCHHDVGHAIGAVATAAAALGWTALVWDAWPDDALNALLGTHRQEGIEAEHADTLIALIPAPWVGAIPPSPAFTRDDLARLRERPVNGTPNRLSAEHHEWEIIEVARRATHRETPCDSGLAAPIAPVPGSDAPGIDARRLIHARRSAVDMDGRSGIPVATFFELLERLRPGAHPASRPWPFAPRVHLAIYVHRVDGLAPGIYALIRNPDDRDRLLAQMRNDFEWATPPDLPATLEGSFVRLRAGDMRGAAAGLACGQHIAGDGAFSVAMIAPVELALRAHGAWFYRRLHWECGLVGQILYLEAEAAGLRGTGIGCFFDDATRDHLGLHADWQSLYHFTVGAPVEDARLRTLAPFAHLVR